VSGRGCSSRFIAVVLRLDKHFGLRKIIFSRNAPDHEGALRYAFTQPTYLRFTLQTRSQSYLKLLVFNEFTLLLVAE
jgi:hypothetical protein